MTPLLMLLAGAMASDVYQKVEADGTLAFTDSPNSKGFEKVFLDPRNLPDAGNINTRTFPLLDTWDSEILAAALANGISPALIKAVCLAESGMNPSAESSAGAMGLMQLMPKTAEELGVTDAYDPQQNIDGGTRYLAKQLRSFGSKRLALAAYNAGPANVKKYGGIPPFEETQVYVERVLTYYQLFARKRPVRGVRSRMSTHQSNASTAPSLESAP